MRNISNPARSISTSLRQNFWRQTVLLAFLTLLGSTARELTVAHAAPPPETKPEFPDVQLSHKRSRGEDAITELGDKLPAVAAYYKTTPEELRKRMREDKSLWVDERGRLFYVCDWGIPPVDDSNPPPHANLIPGFSYSDTFKLHSRPGASKIIYLDFDGHDASGTPWGSDAIGKPYDTDNNPSNFSAAERDVIQYIWQRVAEDYALFDIDVTTEEPGTEALRRTTSGDTNYGVRCVIGGSSYDWYGAGAGGVSYVGTFDEINASGQSRPNWVWPSQLGTTSDKNIAEAVSHEVGHALGLSHDGRISPSEGYYQGQGNWAPIMGVGYYRPISQWSKGEYTSANQTQDDLVVMQGNGAAYRPDDYGNTIGTAATTNGVSFIFNGNIEQENDVDYFSFQSGAGRVTITATPAPRGANLHILLSLYDSTGALITSTNVADTSGGTQPNILSAIVPIGTYYVSIDGVGVGDPLVDGYSDYASVGQYTLAGSLPADSTWLPTPAAIYSWTNPGNWASGVVALGADATARVNNNIVGDQTITLDMPIKIGRFYLGDAAASHTFTIQSGLGGSFIFSSTNNSAFISKSSGLGDTIAVPISLQSDLAVTNISASDLIISGIISGSRGLTKQGAARLVLSGVNTYTGSTVIAGGTLALGATGSILTSTNINVRTGAVLDATLPGGLLLTSVQTLGGAGGVVGDTTVPTGTSLTPGTNGIAGTLTFSNNLTLNTGAKLTFDLANATTVGEGVNDLIAVAGNLTLNGSVPVTFNFLNSFPVSPGTYTLFTYSGTLTGGAGNLTPVNLGTGYTFTFDDSVPGEIRVQVNGAPANLVWQGDGLLNRWDVQSSSNWLSSGNPAVFSQLDTVTFGDPGSTSPSVSLLGTLTPTAVTVNSANNYTFTGSGKIGGAASLTKSGTGILTISSANDYSGLTAISNGTLKVASATALGNVTNGTVIGGGATLDLNAMNLGPEPVTVQANGLVTSSSASVQSNALRFITLTGNATFGGTGRWDVRAAPSGAFVANNFALTKTNANDIWLADLGNTGLGDINVSQGALTFQGTTAMGDSTKTLSVSNLASVNLWAADTNILNKKLSLNGSGFNSLFGNSTFNGTITLSGSNAVTVSDILTLGGVMSGTGGFTKFGPGILMLNGANTYDGTTYIPSGTVTVRNSTALGTTNGSTIITSGGRLDINGINLGAEPITVSGSGLGAAGAIVNNGSSQANALRFVTLTGSTTFGGIGRWDIRANPTGTLNATNTALTKIGPNEVWMGNLGTNSLGNITCSEGVLGIIGSTSLGNPSSTLTINSSGTFGLAALGTNIAIKNFTMNGGRLYNSNGVNVVRGSMNLASGVVLDAAASTTLILGTTITNSGPLTSSGVGTVILTNNNSYSGLTTINAGIFQFGNATATGSPGNGDITNNTTLIFNRTNAVAVSGVISGPGVLNQNGSGVLTLNGVNTYAGITTINAGAVAVGTDLAFGTGGLTFNAAGAGSVGLWSASVAARTVPNNLTIANGSVIFGAPGTGDLLFNGADMNCGSSSRTLTISNTTTTINNPITVSQSSLIKDGPGTLVLAGNNTFVGNTIISLGTLRIDAENRLGNNPAAPFKPTHLTLSGGTLETIASFAIDDSNRGLTLGTLGGTFNVNPGTTLSIANPIAGIGALTKTGTGILALSAVNTHNGNTLITAGTLALSGTGSIANSPLIRVDGGAIFDVTGVSGTYTLSNAQTLAGNGTINGAVIANGTIAPGTSIGRLNFANPLTLSGVTQMETTKTGSVLTNDVVAVTGTVTYGGTLNVTHTGNTLTNGDFFKLFNASTYAGNFATKNLPPLGPGLRWNTAQLAANGTIQVTNLISPQILPVSLSGTNLMISIQSEAGVNYVLQATDDLAQPVVWTSAVTNVGTGGILTFPTPVDPAYPDRYFRITAY